MQDYFSEPLPIFRPLNEEWRRFFKLIPSIKAKRFPVCISGEKGTGKDFCVKILEYELGLRDNEIFVANPHTILENDFPVSEKYKMVVFKQSQKVTPESQVHVSNAMVSLKGMQIVWISEHSLMSQVEMGDISEELLYALNIFNFHLPPLNEMPNDLLGFVNLFLKSLCLRSGISEIVLRNSDVKELKNRTWPRNLDTLLFLLKRSLAIHPGGDFKFDFSSLPSRYVPEPSDSAACADQAMDSDVPVDTLEKSVNEFKKKLVLDTIKRANGNKSNAAKLLGVSKAYIFRLINILDINLD
jgi:DNA-binding NtrC family response regulator